jgi:hypothetical protein
MKKVLLTIMSVSIMCSCFSCRGGAAKYAVVKGTEYIYDKCNEESSSTSTENVDRSNVSFTGSDRSTNNHPCEICDDVTKCSGYDGYYKGYFTDCKCGHAHSFH